MRGRMDYGETTMRGLGGIMRRGIRSRGWGIMDIIQLRPRASFHCSAVLRIFLLATSIICLHSSDL